jgi:hypothetical protein
MDIHTTAGPEDDAAELTFLAWKAWLEHRDIADAYGAAGLSARDDARLKDQEERLKHVAHIAFRVVKELRRLRREVSDAPIGW